MAANNAAARARSATASWSTIVLAIDALLADGEPISFGEVPGNLGAVAMPARYLELIQSVRALAAREADEIATAFPKLLRRVGGYNLDRVRPVRRTTWRTCWSAPRARSPCSAASSCELQPLPAAQGAGRLPFPDLLTTPWRRPRHIVELGPVRGRAGRPHDPRAGARRSRPSARPDRAFRARRARRPCCWSSSPATSRTSSARSCERLSELMADLGLPDGVVRGDRARARRPGSGRCARPGSTSSCR